MKRYEDSSFATTEIAKHFTKGKEYTTAKHYNSALVHVRAIRENLLFWEMWLLQERDKQEREQLAAFEQ